MSVGVALACTPVRDAIFQRFTKRVPRRTGAAPRLRSGVLANVVSPSRLAWAHSAGMPLGPAVTAGAAKLGRLDSLQYARDMGIDLADKFVGMYVNDWSLDYGDAGRESIRRFLRRGHEMGVVPVLPELEFVE